MCLGKIMALGLVYSLSIAFLGSKAALALYWIKTRSGRDAVGGFGVSGAVERKTPLKQFFVAKMSASSAQSLCAFPETQGEVTLADLGYANHFSSATENRIHISLKLNIQ